LVKGKTVPRAPLGANLQQACSCQPASRQALLLTHTGCFPWMFFFFTHLDAGNHWSIQICL